MRKIDKVRQFNRISECPQPKNPIIPKDRHELRVRLLQEELDELKGAIATNNLVEVLDAFCDLEYVLKGAILEFGLLDVFDEAFDRVHDSNMSKFCKTEKEADDSAANYYKQGVACLIKQNDDLWVIKRLPDSKTLKSLYYKPVNLKDLVSNT